MFYIYLRQNVYLEKMICARGGEEQNISLY